MALTILCDFLQRAIWEDTINTFYWFQVGELLSNREISTGNDCEKEMLSLEPHLSQVARVFIKSLKKLKEGLFSVLNTVQNWHRLMAPRRVLHNGWFRETLWQLPGVMIWPSFFGICKKEHQGKLKCEARAWLLTGMFVALLLENASDLTKAKVV